MATAQAFADYWKQAFDPNQIFSAMRHNMEAVTAANQIVVRCAQDIARHQAQTTREQMEHYMGMFREALSGGSPEASLARSAEATREAAEDAWANWQEVSAMATKSGLEALDVLNQQAVQNFQTTAQATKRAGAKASAN